MSQTRLKIWSNAYALLVLVAIGYLVSFGTKFPLQTSVLSLLPTSALGDGPANVNEAFLERLNKQVVFLVSVDKTKHQTSYDSTNKAQSEPKAPSVASTIAVDSAKDADSASEGADSASEGADSASDADDMYAVKVADSFYAKLQKSGVFASLKGKQDDAFRNAWGSFYFNNRVAFVNSDIRASLKDGSIVDYVLAQAFSPFSGISHTELSNDPLLLTRQEQIALSSQGGSLTLLHDYLVAKEDFSNTHHDAASEASASDAEAADAEAADAEAADAEAADAEAAEGTRNWYFIYGELDGSSFSYTESKKVVDAIDGAIASLQSEYPDALVLKRGAVFYSNAAAQSSKFDMEVLGSSTILLVIILLIVTFRSIIPLFAALGSIFCGLILGLAATLLVFHEVFAFTLVMSLSLVGLSCDYTLYYMTILRRGKRDKTELTSVDHVSKISKVKKAIIAACLTTVVAYVLLVVTPFPGVRQMAVFAVFALLGSCAFVLLYHNWWAQKVKSESLVGFSLVKKFLKLYDLPYLKTIMVVVALGIMVGGIFTFKSEDDVKKLSAMPLDLKSQDDAIARITGQNFDQKWLLLYAQDSESLMQSLDDLRPILSKLKDSKTISDYKLIPLNSIKTQEQDYALVKENLPKVISALNDAGLELDYKNLIPFKAVSLNDYISSVASEGYNMLVLEDASKMSAAIVPVYGVKDVDALDKALAKIPHVVYVDTKSSFDKLFSTYRELMSYLLMGALGIILVAMMIRLGIKSGIKAFLPCLFAIGVTVGLLSLSGFTFNLFSILALLLVLGVGVNYPIFFTSKSAQNALSFYGITVAMLTTEFTLGILALSSTEAVRSFGITLCLGVFIAYITSPLSVMTAARSTLSSIAHHNDQP